MKPVLVVSYSRSGITRGIADEIASTLGADRRDINDVIPRAGWRGYLRAGLEAVARGVPSIYADVDPSAYSMVVVGSPVWAGTVASPIRSFLLHCGLALPRPAFFCTCGRSAESALLEMQAMCGVQDAPCYFARRRDIRRRRHARSLHEFTASLHRAIGIAPAAA